MFQSDSNLVIYDTGSNPLWNAKTHRSGATEVIMQDDGDLVLYKGSNLVWRTKTRRC